MKDLVDEKGVCWDTIYSLNNLTWEEGRELLRKTASQVSPVCLLPIFVQFPTFLPGQVVEAVNRVPGHPLFIHQVLQLVYSEAWQHSAAGGVALLVCEIGKATQAL